MTAKKNEQWLHNKSMLRMLSCFKIQGCDKIQGPLNTLKKEVTKLLFRILQNSRKNEWTMIT